MDFDFPNNAFCAMTKVSCFSIENARMMTEETVIPHLEFHEDNKSSTLHSSQDMNVTILLLDIEIQITLSSLHLFQKSCVKQHVVHAKLSFEVGVGIPFNRHYAQLLDNLMARQVTTLG